MFLIKICNIVYSILEACPLIIFGFLFLSFIIYGVVGYRISKVVFRSCFALYAIDVMEICLTGCLLDWLLV